MSLLWACSRMTTNGGNVGEQRTRENTSRLVLGLLGRQEGTPTPTAPPFTGARDSQRAAGPGAKGFLVTYFILSWSSHLRIKN